MLLQQKMKSSSSNAESELSRLLIEMILRAQGIENLILTGVTTSRVVLSTVGQAFDLDYRLIVVNDYCADPDPDTNMFLLKKVLPQHAFVTSSSEISKPGHKAMNF